MGGLFTVVDGVRGGKTLRNKVGSMLVNGIGTFVPAVLSFFVPKRKRDRKVDRARREKEDPGQTSVNGTSQALGQFLQNRHTGQ